MRIPTREQAQALAEVRQIHERVGWEQSGSRTSIVVKALDQEGGVVAATRVTPRGTRIAVVSGERLLPRADFPGAA